MYVTYSGVEVVLLYFSGLDLCELQLTAACVRHSARHPTTPHYTPPPIVLHILMAT